MTTKDYNHDLNIDVIHSQTECIKMLKAIRDAVDVVSGKWKIAILISITTGHNRFGQIAKNVHGITDRMLSKELKDLEINGLITKSTADSFTQATDYLITPHGKSLSKLIVELGEWGVLHRNKVTGKL